MTDNMQISSKFLRNMVGHFIEKALKKQGLDNLTVGINEASVNGENGKFDGHINISFSLPYDDLQIFLKNKDIL